MSVTVVGSTYLERCSFPEWDELYGSGLRAACLLSALGAEVSFHTFAGTDEEIPLRARLNDAKIQDLHLVPIKQTLSFSYVHGLSTPVIHPAQDIYRKWNPSKIQVEAECILRFGFLEGDAIVKGTRVVYDPQNPHDPESFRNNGSEADELALVCNLSEGRHLAKSAGDPEQIADLLIQQKEASVVVLKCGSLGACVHDGNKSEWIPAYRTDNVWPIGSGDVFAAAFAFHWAAGKMSPVEAAKNASAQTADYCDLKLLKKIVTTVPPRPVATSCSKRIYLAGPFFSMSQLWLIGEARRALAAQGHKVFSPLHEVGRGPAEIVYPADIKGIVESDLVYALVDGLDAGTLFEIGYARSIDKPVVVFVQSEREEDLKMLRGSGCHIENDFVTSVYRTTWLPKK